MPGGGPRGEAVAAAGGADAALAIALAGGYGLVTAAFGFPHTLAGGFGLLHALVVTGAVAGALGVGLEAGEEAVVTIAGGFTPSKMVSYGIII
jgi:hypothetical protein